MDAAIKELRANYAKELPERTEEIAKCAEKLIAELKAGTVSPDVREFEYLTHRLAGSSGTYGFTALSSVTRYMEELVAEQNLFKHGAAKSSEQLERWLVVFRDLAARAHAMQPENSRLGDEAVRALEAHLGKVAA